MANVGNARLEVTANTAPAQASFKSLALEAAKTLSAVKIEPSFDAGKAREGDQ